MRATQTGSPRGEAHGSERIKRPTNFGCILPVRAMRRDCSRRERKSELEISDQVWVLPLSPFLHWASNFAYCSGVRIDFACSMYLASLASEQPAF
jgi:hypothetical protein